ncbi:hypothetical protein R1sor_007774 [Riccia sorocarpa]|uniref:Protein DETOXIFICATION n=1 Tax=Riccia sorocarpa TaxID=122646 RepID=A0ABD3HRQ3_9MARC
MGTMNGSKLGEPLLKDVTIDKKEPLLESPGVQSTSKETPEFRTWVKSEVKQQFSLAAPVITVNLLLFATNCVSLMFLGHLGELSLASASIAMALATLSGYTVLMGMATALETLCRQAYDQKVYPLLGIYLQQGIWIFNCVALVLSMSIWWNMTPILKFMGQDPRISEGAGIYARYLIPTLFSYATLQPMVRFLLAQDAGLAIAIFSAITTLCCHISLCWLLIFKLKYGMVGAAIASGVSEWLNVIFLALYIGCSPKFGSTWRGFSKRAFQDVGVFLKSAMPSTAMLCMDAWTFQIVVLLSGYLPNTKAEISALSICLNTLTILYMFHYGLSAALSMRVSSELRAKRPANARGAVGVTLTLGLIEGIVVAVALYFMRFIWPMLYTSDPKVIRFVANIVPVLSIVAVVDAFEGTLNGVARGCGWQLLAACTNLVAFYGVGVPSAAVLAFVFNYRGRGLWLGVILGLCTQALIVGTITFNTNWEKQSQRVRERVQREVLPTIAENDEVEEE